jgi:hypothetical protein
VEGESTYIVDEAAAILEETPERVREMLQTGDLDGIPPAGTLSGEWKVLLPSNLGEESPARLPQALNRPHSGAVRCGVGCSGGSWRA